MIRCIRCSPKTFGKQRQTGFGNGHYDLAMWQHHPKSRTQSLSVTWLKRGGMGPSAPSVRIRTLYKSDLTQIYDHPPIIWILLSKLPTFWPWHSMLKSENPLHFFEQEHHNCQGPPAPGKHLDGAASVQRPAYNQHGTSVSWHRWGEELNHHRSGLTISKINGTDHIIVFVCWSPAKTMYFF